MLLASSDKALYIRFGLGHSRANVTANIKSIEKRASRIQLRPFSCPPPGECLVVTFTNAVLVVRRAGKT